MDTLKTVTNFEVQSTNSRVPLVLRHSKLGFRPMLENDFYIIRNQQVEHQQLRAQLVLNAEHAIFQGHFPELPIVPGVCMVQMLKELTENVVGKKLHLESASIVKFLAVLQPTVHTELEANLDIKPLENSYSVSGSFQSAETVFFKFKGKFHAKVGAI